ncbi:putative ribosome-binding factor A, mitochondrial [Acanthaster planci]|uniref:Ribosome-binding factor A, mitochondrial n=1 Tax=Acanthaster planci TaxID=133434 RepID=A0A8B7ZPE6_ACAPL|nr:putative ribosome-binding factor A, mitochondrial [Acanthaster planci]
MTHFVQVSKALTSCHLRRPLVGLCNFHSSLHLFKGRKSLIKLDKLLAKKKKKFYYDPMNVAQLGRLATGVSGGKVKMRSEDSIRLRTYNKILFDNINDMMTTSLISEELEELQVTVSGVRVAGDMSACRVYWQSTGVVQDDERIEKVLNRHKGPLRRALISHRVLGKIPPIFFLKDKASANLSEIDRLLAIADFGPDEEEEIELMEVELNTAVENSNSGGRMEFIQKSGKNEMDASGEAQPSLFGIDHDALNRLIKRGDVSNPFTGIHGELAEDRASDKRFQQLRAFMKKKKMGETGKKEAAFYRGELESYGSGRRGDVEIEDETAIDSEESFSDEDYDNGEDGDEFTSELPRDK